MFNSNKYKAETVIRGLASIPLKQTAFLCGFGILVGGPVALICFILFLKQGMLTDNSIFYISGMFAGGFLFLLGATVPYIIYLSKELQRLKECLCEECSLKVTEKATKTNKPNKSKHPTASS